ncbi:MAG: ComF family protein [Burkholderiales bacterium]|nr:ComF family protein [Burkholderiales bacterium]PZN03064.1 MAG: phosphoribosyltransferase [Pseudomonadota bacterium]
MSSIAAHFARLRRALLAQDCLLCAAPGGDGLLCAACAAELPQLAPGCPQCALPGTGGELCGRCLREAPAYDRTVACWRYAFPLDRLVQALKYGNRLALADWFGRALAAKTAQREVDLIVPMPLHRRRLRERGFNQAMEIARRLRGIGRLAPGALVRLKDTTPQTGLSDRERAQNVRGAFAATVPLSGLRIALVDDVMTTGASLHEAARALKRAGAADVENWVVARATGPAVLH